MIFGVSFSPQYARYLGLDMEKTYKTIIDDWQFKYIRLSAQWDWIEKTKGQYDFKELDYLMDEAKKRNVKATIAIGRKTPRWPECHLPEWAKKLTYAEYKPLLLNFIKTTVERYKNHSALEIWQVENEPFLAFGLCGVMSEQDFKAEIQLVKKADSQHPVMATDSGELSTWRKTARAGDLFGTTIYRVVWNKYLGFFNYDLLPAVYYRLKLWLWNRDLNTAYISELQAEPWIPNIDLSHTPLSEQFKSMDIVRLKKNIEYAQKTNMSRAYLWGAEWWQWMKEKQTKVEYVDFVKMLKKE